MPGGQREHLSAHSRENTAGVYEFTMKVKGWHTRGLYRKCFKKMWNNNTEEGKKMADCEWEGISRASVPKDE